jgi:hypothetical protein
MTLWKVQLGHLIIKLELLVSIPSFYINVGLFYSQYVPNQEVDVGAI